MTANSVNIPCVAYIVLFLMDRFTLHLGLEKNFCERQIGNTLGSVGCMLYTHYQYFVAKPSSVTDQLKDKVGKALDRPIS